MKTNRTLSRRQLAALGIGVLVLGGAANAWMRGIYMSPLAFKTDAPAADQAAMLKQAAATLRPIRIEGDLGERRSSGKSLMTTGKHGTSTREISYAILPSGMRLSFLGGVPNSGTPVLVNVEPATSVTETDSLDNQLRALSTGGYFVVTSSEASRFIRMGLLASPIAIGAGMVFAAARRRPRRSRSDLPTVAVCPG